MSDDTAPEAAAPRRRSRAAIAIIAANVVAAILFLAPSYIRPDSVGVYSYLRSAVIDHDLLFFDEWEAFRMVGDGFAFFKETTAVGALANHWWIGASLLSAPFYAGAHAVAIAFPKLAPFHDGFFGIYGAVLAWTSVLFVTFAMLLGDSLMKRIGFSRTARVIAHCGVWSGTPLFWYELRMPLGTHAAGAMCVAVVTWALWRQLNGEETSLLAGVATGLAIATRLQHVLLIPALAYALWRSKASLGAWIRAAAGMSAPVVVQAIAWWTIYGTPFGPVTRGANLTGVTWMPFRTFAILPVLLSSYHGLLAWSPVAIVAIAGWFLLRRDQRHFSDVLLLMFAGQLFANSFLDRYWWGGLSFGPRRFTDLAIPFAIGIAAAARWRWKPVCAAAIGSAAWSLALAFAATRGLISLSRDVSGSEVVSAALHGFGAVPLDRLHSPATDRGLLLLSVVSVALIALIMGALTLYFTTSSRVAAGLTVYAAAAAVALFLLWAPTRSRAKAEWSRLHLVHGRAERVGPLLDEHQLLHDELSYLTRQGNHRAAAKTAGEIAAIEHVLQTIK